MTSRVKLMQSLNYKEPDRVPIDLGATIVSSIAKKAFIELKQYQDMPVGEIKMLNYVQQLPYVDDALMEWFGVDFRMVQLPATTTVGQEVVSQIEAVHRNAKIEPLNILLIPELVIRESSVVK